MEKNISQLNITIEKNLSKGEYFDLHNFPNLNPSKRSLEDSNPLEDRLIIMENRLETIIETSNDRPIQDSKDSTIMFLKENNTIINDNLPNSFTFSKIKPKDLKNKNGIRPKKTEEINLKEELTKIILQYEELKRNSQETEENLLNKISILESENEQFHNIIQSLQRENEDKSLIINNMNPKIAELSLENQKLNELLTNIIQEQFEIDENTNKTEEISDRNNQENDFIPTSHRYMFQTLKDYKKELDNKIKLLNEKSYEAENWKKNFEESEKNYQFEILQLKKSLDKLKNHTKNSFENPPKSFLECKWEQTQNELNEMKIQTNTMNDEIKKLTQLLLKKDRENARIIDKITKNENIEKENSEFFDYKNYFSEKKTLIESEQNTQFKKFILNN